jgi:hypothetical protein
LAFANCSRAEDLKKEASFREDFSSEKLSVFRWGAPTFSLYKFKADPSMVSNVGGII